MLTHGAGKVMMLIGDDPIKFGDPVGIGPAASLVLAAFAEFACSLLLIFGAATRFAVIPLIVTMLVAGLIVHAGDAFRVEELAFLYLSIFITIAFTGSGKFSVDNLIYKKIDNQNN